jgi:alanyl-tRNA synthetase
LVAPDRLRFDFTNDKPLSETEIQQIEQLVNHEIGLAHTVQPKVCSFKQAVADGALALFGEKYGEEVRFLTIGPSKELCGGTHVSNTAQIRLFKIVSETGVSRGVRRIEALTGTKAFEYLMNAFRENSFAKQAAQIQEGYQELLKEKSAQDFGLVKWVENKKKEIKEIEKSVHSLKSQNLDADSYISSGKKFSDGTLVYAHLDTDDRKVLSDLSDKIKDKLGTGIIIVSGNSPAGCPLIISVTKNITQKYNAGKILQDFASKLGGKGGGRPDFAQGSIPTLQGLDQHIQSLLN